jgi:hypothetical protein
MPPEFVSITPTKTVLDHGEAIKITVLTRDPEARDVSVSFTLTDEESGLTASQALTLRVDDSGGYTIAGDADAGTIEHLGSDPANVFTYTAP